MPLEDALIEDPIQVMFNGGVAAMRELLRVGSRAVDTAVTVSLTEYEHRDFSLIDITDRRRPPRGTRWRGAPRSSASSRDQVMAIGDNFNDLEMLEFAGLPVVMGNAVRAAARPRVVHQTGSQDEAGVAQAIQRFVLKARSEDATTGRHDRSRVGYVAVTTVLMPPRTVKSPTTVIRRGLHAATRSSRIWLVAAS